MTNRLHKPNLTGSSPYVVYVVYVSTSNSFIVIFFVVLIVLLIGGTPLLVAALVTSNFGTGSPVLVVTWSNNDQDINRRPALINKNEEFMSQCIILNFPEPGAQSVTVYQTPCQNLSIHNNSLEEMTFPVFTPLKGDRNGYNYFVQRDVSINLGPGSYLKYVVNATSTSSDPGCLRLCLIDSEQLYEDFKGNKNTTIVPCKECVNVGNATNEAITEIIFNITVQGDYYVAYDSPGSISITSAISGVQTYYSVTGLAEWCPSPLSSTNPTCTRCLCQGHHSPGFCFDLDTEPVCLLAQTSGTRQDSNTNITYQVQNNSFAGKSAYIFSAFLLYILCITIVVVICALVIITLYIKYKR